MPSFRQPGDMGRYIAFNDPGQPGAGFSSYEEYLNAGNKPFNTSGPLQSATLGGGLNSLVSQPIQQFNNQTPIKLGGSQGNMGPSPSGQLAGGFGGIVNNSIRPGGGLTLAGMAQQPMQQPMQQPLGNSLSSLNQQPFSTSLQPQQFGMNQQPQQINGGIRSLLDSYIGNYINNYFKNALR